MDCAPANTKQIVIIINTKKRFITLPRLVEA